MFDFNSDGSLVALILLELARSLDMPMIKIAKVRSQPEMRVLYSDCSNFYIICLSIHLPIGPSAGWRCLRISQRGLRAGQRGLSASQEGWSYRCEERHTDGCTDFLPILLDCPLYWGHCLKSQEKKTLSYQWYFFLLLGSEGGNWGDKWVMHPRLRLIG